jgi:hypothetical protein
MKTNYPLLVLLFFLPGILFSQNWQNVCSPGTTFYSDTSDNVKAFRRDSTLVLPGPDTIFYSYRTIKDSMNLFNCLDTTGGSVLGEKVILTHDGWYYFFNIYHDTIKVNSAAGTGQSWRFCSLAGGGYVTATVTSVASELVLGQPDQVRLINLQAKDQSGNSINHPLNIQPFKLSQHFGLVTFYDVYFLPENVKPFSLAGKSTPPLGLQEFGWRAVYDFMVGDQFHYHGYASNAGGTANSKIIMNVIGKISYGTDSADYTFERCRRMEAAPPPGVTTLQDTVLLRYNFIAMDTANLFMPLPEELKPNEWAAPNGVANRYYRRNNDFNGRNVKSIEYDYYNFDITVPACWSVSLWEYWHLEEFSPGLGLTHYQTNEMWFSMWETLVYFKKGAETWGTPVATDCQTLVGIEDHPDGVQPIVNVYPNPANEKITLTLTGSIDEQEYTFRIYNLYGQMVTELPIQSTSLEIPTGHLPRGIYLWSISGRPGSGSGKLILN